MLSTPTRRRGASALLGAAIVRTLSEGAGLPWAPGARDPELFAALRDHSLRVGQYSLLLARRLGLGEAEGQDLAAAAALHDVGLFALPAALLSKPGPLSPREWELVKGHPWLGAAALTGQHQPLLETARSIALSHHERWDGSGYPQGLRREAIPFPARIVAVADHYDALRSARPYKPPYSHRAACAVLLLGDERTRPRHFDPGMLAAFEAAQAEIEALSRTGEVSRAHRSGSPDQG